MSGHSTWPEWVYVGVVIALLCYVGAEAWNIERIVEHVPEDAEIIKVTGQQWIWTFEHEDGTKEIGELHVERGKAYKFEIHPKTLFIHLTFMIMLFCWTQYLDELILFGSNQQKLVNLIFNAGSIVD